MKRIFFIILQLLILQLSFSQENFVPCYIIDGNNDTIQGYINYRSWKTCPEKISFKNSGDLVEKNVLPSDIKGFMVSDKIYVSGFVKWQSLARYKVPVGKVTLFANAGPSIGFGGLGKNQVYIERNFYGQMRYQDQKAINNYEKTEFGLVGGVGLRLKRFTMESRYEYGTGFVNNETLSSSANRVYLLLGVRF